MLLGSRDNATGQLSPAVDADLFSDENILEPDEYRAALRDGGPVVHLPKCLFHPSV